MNETFFHAQMQDKNKYIKIACRKRLLNNILKLNYKNDKSLNMHMQSVNPRRDPDPCLSQQSRALLPHSPVG